MNAFQLELFKKAWDVEIAKLQSELDSIEWEILGHKSYLTNFNHTPQHPLVSELLRAEQERLQMRCAIANAKREQAKYDYR
jgi:hypothetical protein